MFGRENRMVTGAPAPPARDGPEIVEVETSKLGFMALGEGSRVRLLPQPWPANKLPPSTSQLFSVASIAGLVAAADPTSLFVGSTDSLRAAFDKPGQNDGSAKPYEPQLKIDIGTRLSQVVFTSDDEYLIVCAEDGGGLQVYKTSALKQGQTQYAFQAATGGIGVRSIQPNPVEGRASAVVLADGKLLLAEFNAQGSGADFKPLKESGVSCASWSARGKQLVAGLDDATVLQLQPDGTPVVTIPRPPQLEGNAHVGSVTWLDNDNFLIVYNPNEAPSDQPAESASFMVKRIAKNETFEFRRFPFEPSPAFGLNRSPAYHFVQRVREWDPNLKDLLLISNTCSTDIGVVARHAAALDPTHPEVVGTYAMVRLEDARKAELPLPANADLSSVSALGTAIDLSSTSEVKEPIKREEELKRTGPLPAFMVLDVEGVLSAWWLIHEDAILSNSSYKRLVVNGGPQAAASTTQSSPLAVRNQQSTLGSPSPFGASTPAKPAFGQSAFGQPSKPAFGQSGFASASPAAPAFGQTSTFGQPSTFGQSTFGQPSKPAFGSTSSIGLGANTKTFGSFSGGASGQASFANVNANGSASSPFGAVNKDNANPSPFGAAKKEGFAAFGQNSSSSSPFGAISNGGSSGTSLFGQQKQDTSKSTFASATNESGSIFNRKGTPPDSPFAAIGKAAPQSQPQPSFGSTVTLGSTLGTNNSFGVSSFNSKSPFGTPALSTQPTEVSKTAAEEASMDDSDMNMDSMSGLGLAEKKEDRDETPKPEPKPQEPAKSPTKEGKAEPPLPPDPFAGGKQQVGASESKTDQTATKKEPEDAPLPPDFTTTSKKEVTPEPAPLPPSPKKEQQSSTPFDTPIKQEEKPSQPFLFPPAQKPSKPSSPLARPPTPPVDIKQEEQSPVGSEPEDLANDSAYVESPTRSQLPGSEDNTQTAGISTWPRSPRGKPPIPPNFRQESPLSKPSTGPSLFSPEAQTKPPPAQTPFSSAPLFQPPAKPVTDTPRSPSPVRDQQQALGRRLAQPRRSSGSPSRSTSRSPERAPSTSLFSKQSNLTQQQQRVPTPQLQRVPEAPATPASAAKSKGGDELILDDQEEAAEEKERARLNEPLSASLTLGHFEAHSDYVGHIRSTGLPANMERVYRDIDSMLDVLGWNARTLGAFIKGHTELTKQTSERDLYDLDEAQQGSWVLDEIQDLHGVVDDLADQLAHGRLPDARATRSQCTALDRSALALSKLARSLERQLSEIRAAHSASSPTSPSSPSAAAAPRARLTPEQTSSLSTLRLSHTRVQESLRAAEDALSLLRAKLAAAHATAAPGSSASAMPTVEAVTKTIAKMTRTAETKRGDVDHLEAQIRRLRRDRLLARHAAARASPNPDDLAFGALAISPGHASKDGSALRRSLTASTPTPTPPSRSPHTPARASPGRFSVPDSNSNSDSESDAHAHAHVPASKAQARGGGGTDAEEGSAQLLRLRARLAKTRPAAWASVDDVLDARVARAQRRRVLCAIRGVVLARADPDLHSGSHSDERGHGHGGGEA